jgi:hypothetical protein
LVDSEKKNNQRKQTVLPKVHKKRNTNKATISVGHLLQPVKKCVSRSLGLLGTKISYPDRIVAWPHHHSQRTRKPID